MGVNGNCTVSQIPNLEAVTEEAWCLKAPHVSTTLLSSPVTAYWKLLKCKSPTNCEILWDLCVIQSECQIAKLLPPVLPDSNSYKEERILLHGGSDTSKRYPKLFQDILPYACCHRYSVQIFLNSRGYLKPTKCSLTNSTASQLTLNRMLTSFTFKRL